MARDVSRQQQAFSGLQSTRWPFSIKISYLLSSIVATLQDVYLDEGFDHLLEEVREVKPDIQIFANLRPAVKQPLSVVRTYISRNQQQWLEYCQQFDSHGGCTISRSNFVTCLKVCRGNLLVCFGSIGKFDLKWWSTWFYVKIRIFPCTT